MLTGIFGGKVPDEVENFEGNLLHHRLDAIIKLGFTNSHSLESELRLTLNKPRLDVVWQDQGQLHHNSLEQVCARENDGTPSMTAESQGMASAEKKHCQTNNTCLPMRACAENREADTSFG